MKLHRAMQALGTSAGAVINELLSRMEIDAAGRPLWATAATHQGALIDIPPANRAA